jgi:hypothetical protein
MIVKCLKIQYSYMVYIQKGQQLASIENQYQPCFKCRVKPQGANLPNTRGLGQDSRWFKLCILRMSPTHWAFPHHLYIKILCLFHDQILTLPNHGAPCCAFGIVKKSLARWCACSISQFLDQGGKIYWI